MHCFRHTCDMTRLSLLARYDDDDDDDDDDDEDHDAVCACTVVDIYAT